jgi:prevent-host-death family protein
MIINIHADDTQLSELIAKAEAGEEVIISRGGKPVARLTAVIAAARLEPDPLGDLPAWLGSLRGQVWISPDIEA